MKKPLDKMHAAPPPPCSPRPRFCTLPWSAAPANASLYALWSWPALRILTTGIVGAGSLVVRRMITLAPRTVVDGAFAAVKASPEVRDEALCGCISWCLLAVQ